MPSFLSIIPRLFSHPSIFRQLRYHRTFRALLTFLIFLIPASAISILLQLGPINEEIKLVQNWLEANVESVTLNEQGMVINTIKPKPLLSEFLDHQIYISDENGLVPQQLLEMHEPLVHISPVEIIYFSPNPETGKMSAASLVNLDRLKQTSAETVDISEVKSYVNLLPWMLGMAYYLRIFIYVFLCSLIFALIQLPYRSVIFHGLKFSNILAIYIYASIPATLVAIIYSSIPGSGLDFELPYLIGLLAYIFFCASKPLKIGALEELLRPVDDDEPSDKSKR